MNTRRSIFGRTSDDARRQLAHPRCLTIEGLPLLRAGEHALDGAERPLGEHEVRAVMNRRRGAVLPRVVGALRTPLALRGHVGAARRSLAAWNSGLGRFPTAAPRGPGGRVAAAASAARGPARAPRAPSAAGGRPCRASAAATAQEEGHRSNDGQVAPRVSHSGFSSRRGRALGGARQTCPISVIRARAATSPARSR